MGTRSMIGILNDNDTVTASYCHYDGYVDGVGKTLIESYNTNHEAKMVANGGYLSSLGPNYSESKESAVNADEAEIYINEAEFKSEADFNGAEYIYLWDGSDWLFQKVYGEYKHEGFDLVKNCLEEVA
jgi:hypothetical protein